MPVMGFTKFERFFRAVGGVALARTFKLIDAELKAVHTAEWERAFSLFRLLI